MNGDAAGSSMSCTLERGQKQSKKQMRAAHTCESCLLVLPYSRYRIPLSKNDSLSKSVLRGVSHLQEGSVLAIEGSSLGKGKVRKKV